MFQSPKNNYILVKTSTSFNFKLIQILLFVTIIFLFLPSNMSLNADPGEKRNTTFFQRILSRFVEYYFIRGNNFEVSEENLKKVGFKVCCSSISILVETLQLCKNWFDSGFFTLPCCILHYSHKSFAKNASLSNCT